MNSCLRSLPKDIFELDNNILFLNNNIENEILEKHLDKENI